MRINTSMIENYWKYPLKLKTRPYVLRTFCNEIKAGIGFNTNCKNTADMNMRMN